jgi:hypothetical protein
LVQIELRYAADFYSNKPNFKFNILMNLIPKSTRILMRNDGPLWGLQMRNSGGESRDAVPLNGFLPFQFDFASK